MPSLLIRRGLEQREALFDRFGVIMGVLHSSITGPAAVVDGKPYGYSGPYEAASLRFLRSGSRYRCEHTFVKGHGGEYDEISIRWTSCNGETTCQLQCGTTGTSATVYVTGTHAEEAHLVPVYIGLKSGANYLWSETIAEAKPEAVADVLGGVTCYRVTTALGDQLWVSRDLGYVPVRYESTTRQTNGGARRIIRWGGFREVAPGLFVPGHAICKNSLSLDGQWCTSFFRAAGLHSFELDPPIDDRDFTLAFPPGVPVVDDLDQRTSTTGFSWRELLDFSDWWRVGAQPPWGLTKEAIDDP